MSTPSLEHRLLQQRIANFAAQADIVASTDLPTGE
jgi:hypothetical protein